MQQRKKEGLISHGSNKHEEIDPISQISKKGGLKMPSAEEKNLNRLSRAAVIMNFVKAKAEVGIIRSGWSFSPK